MINLQTQIIQRANTTSQWNDPDTPENYKNKTKFGQNLYSPDDFNYKFNDYGFRCDNFNQESDIPIVFLGCNHTEGTGLPMEHVWAYQLIKKIRNKTSKNIPYWNLAIGGASVDTLARHLYWFNEIHKPKFVFALFPGLFRREYCLKTNNPNTWGLIYGQRPEINELFIDNNFKYHQSNRSFMIIDSIIKQNNTQMHCSMWRYTSEEDDETFLRNNFLDFNFFPHTIAFRDRARDTVHHGPTYHIELANLFWDRICHHF